MSGKWKRTVTMIESSERRNSMKNMMQKALQYDAPWSYEENRQKAHEILDIVLDTNTLEGRSTEKTGTLPTVCFRFSGLCGRIVAELYPNGWSGGQDCEEFTFDTDMKISQQTIDAMRRACEDALEGKSGIKAAQQRVKRLEREIRERQQEMNRLGAYIEQQQSGIMAESCQEVEMQGLAEA